MIRKPRVGGLCALLAAFVSFSPAAWALGLGNASVKSYLNEPLRAEIELIARVDDDLTAVTASLASADDFALIGASRAAISVPLRFAIAQTAAGAIISVTSNLPVKEPVIRLIVEVNWASGRMLREYTLFLDPPVFAAPAPSPFIDQRRSAAPTRTAEAPVSTAPAEVEEQSSTASEPLQPEDSVSEGSEYGPVQAGDTLWRIASDWSQGSGQDMNAVMLAIQRNNPQAFINDNINLMKRGAILRMPRMSEISRISPTEARSEVLAQESAIEQDTMAPAVETPLVSAESVTPSRPAADDRETEDKLELVPPSETSDAESAYGFDESTEDSTASTGVQALREELARKEEELFNEQQQNQYLKDKIAELESQVAAGEQPGTVTDPTLSKLEQDLREQRLSEGAGETAGTAAADSAKAQSAPASEPVKPAAKPVVRAQPRKPEAAWYESAWAWLAGAVLLVVAAVVWLFGRRRAPDEDETELDPDDRATVRTIKNEAETILRVLETDAAPAAAAVANAREEPTFGETTVSSWSGKLVDHDEAEVLDEDSVDPEVRLDLARAYISMGDREAARAILNEVVEHGTVEQQSEARAMLGEL